ncbi:DUF2256 domain-containing protein [Nioella sediminis]|uniref:DUF2256 domain-containing protein n=1 Tax=Nioella sediminis TaxID=1912092 RepID=UPI0008FD3A5D|nr:DUF2256 domain-containing protein [Nioella sediminis]
MAQEKPHLPTKICATCGRPFAWRMKWSKVWDGVICCPDRCPEDARRLRILPRR